MVNAEQDMASIPLTEDGVVFWPEFEEDECVPKPLRVVKGSGTYSSLSGDLGAPRPRALNVPRRRSSLGATTPCTEPQGPYGRLTVHKKRNGRSTILLDDLISSFNSDPHPVLAQASAGSPINSQTSGVFELLPPLHPRLTQFSRTFSPIQNSAIPLSTLPPFLPSPDSAHCKNKTTLFSGRALLPKFLSKAQKEFPETDNQATEPLRDVANKPRVKNPPASVPSPYKSHKENFRRSSTVASLQSVFRKLSLTRSISTREFTLAPKVPKMSMPPTPDNNGNTIINGHSSTNGPPVVVAAPLPNPITGNQQPVVPPPGLWQPPTSNPLLSHSHPAPTPAPSPASAQAGPSLDGVAVPSVSQHAGPSSLPPATASNASWRPAALVAQLVPFPQLDTRFLSVAADRHTTVWLKLKVAGTYLLANESWCPCLASSNNCVVGQGCLVSAQDIRLRLRFNPQICLPLATGIEIADTVIDFSTVNGLSVPDVRISRLNHKSSTSFLIKVEFLPKSDDTDPQTFLNVEVDWLSKLSDGPNSIRCGTSFGFDVIYHGADDHHATAYVGPPRLGREAYQFWVTPSAERDAVLRWGREEWGFRDLSLLESSWGSASEDGVAETEATEAEVEVMSSEEVVDAAAAGVRASGSGFGLAASAQYRFLAPFRSAACLDLVGLRRRHEAGQVVPGRAEENLD